MTIEAVIFDMDGVLIDSEPRWNQARIEMAEARGTRWTEEDQRSVMGSSTLEWARKMKQVLRHPGTLEEVIAELRQRMIDGYRRELPLLPGAVEAVKRMATAFGVGLASGSTTALIDHVLGATGLDCVVQAVVYGDTIPRGKPSPDIYLEAARRFGLAPGVCVGIEDSAHGVHALRAAGMKVVAVPSPGYPLSEEVLAKADLRLVSLNELTIERVRALA
jgi:HAD superfamily hydrolase (TIGR01509 family)